MSKIVKKSENPLSFIILGGRNSTRALQSNPFQKYKNLEKSLKNPFKKKFRKKKALPKKEKQAWTEFTVDASVLKF